VSGRSKRAQSPRNLAAEQRWAEQLEVTAEEFEAALSQMAQQAAQSFDALSDQPDLQLARSLARVALLHRWSAVIQAQIDKAAQEARDQGASWGILGARIGASPQAAHQRWSEDGRAKHAERQRKRAAAEALSGLSIFVQHAMVQTSEAGREVLRSAQQLGVRRQILEFCIERPRPIPALVEHTHLAPESLEQQLTELASKGLVSISEPVHLTAEEETYLSGALMRAAGSQMGARVGGSTSAQLAPADDGEERQSGRTQH
jgi:hypothetical protein